MSQTEIIVFISLLIGFIAVILYVGVRCKKCNRLRAMEKTGETESGRWWERTLEEWECKHCGHTEWKQKNESGQGGDG